MIMIENSIYFVGPFLLTDMIGPNLDRLLKGYQIDWYIKSPIDQPKGDYNNRVTSLMTWDLRHTKAPKIDNGNIDFFFMGELRYMDLHHDECPWDPTFV